MFVIKNKAFGISIPQNILEQIDKDRKDVSRSRYLLRVLERSFGNQKEQADSSESRIGSLETDESFDKVR